jgi:hypothetical protein
MSIVIREGGLMATFERIELQIHVMGGEHTQPCRADDENAGGAGHEADELGIGCNDKP